jgi:hypothetical protein
MHNGPSSISDCSSNVDTLACFNSTQGAGFVKAMNKDLSHLKVRILLISFIVRIITRMKLNDQHCQLKLSHEHQGFVFEPSLAKAADLLIKHSGGKITTALKTAIELGSIKYTEPERPKPDEDDTEHIIESKELPPPKEEKNILDCFNCWK